MESGSHPRDETIKAYFDREEVRDDPYPLFRELRSRKPFYNYAGAWIVLRRAEAVSILTDARFIYPEEPAEAGVDDNEWGKVVTGLGDRNLVLKIRQKSAQLFRLGLFARNPPDHTRLRPLMMTTFTREKLAGLGLRAQAVADRLLENLKSASKIDVVADLAFPLTLQVISEALGVTLDPVAMRGWSRDLSASLAFERNQIDQERGLFAIAALAEFLRKTISARGADSNHGMLDFLVQASAKGQLSTDEVLANCNTILLGNLTTQHLIGSGVLLLLKHPEQLQLLRENPALLGRAVEEILRYEAPIPRVRRIAKTDVTISGQTIRKGERVVLLLGSANRDPDLCSDPDRFDITRPPVQHLSFGLGIHFCIGAALARMEAAIAFGSLLRHFPRLRLESDEPRWEKPSLFRGLETLPVLTD